MLNKQNVEDCNLLEERIILVCNQIQEHIFNIESERIVKNINFVFDTCYTLEDVNYILGFIYEKQFYKEKEEYNVL
jgi:hypothetical protein